MKYQFQVIATDARIKQTNRASVASFFEKPLDEKDKRIENRGNTPISDFLLKEGPGSLNLQLQ